MTFRDEDIAVGGRNVGGLIRRGASLATPALPSVIRTLPSGLNLKTCMPFPLPPCSSVTLRFPSGSSWRRAGKLNIPSPQASGDLPDLLNLRMGGSMRPTHEFSLLAVDHIDVAVEERPQRL